MRERIIEAIRGRYEIKFVYDGHPRIVRPAAVGLCDTTGDELLSCYQIDGSCPTGRDLPDWRLFKLQEIEDLIVTAHLFTTHPADYVREEQPIDEIWAQI